MATPLAASIDKIQQPFDEIDRLARDFALSLINGYERKVQQITSNNIEKISPTASLIAERILRGLPIALFIAMVNPAVGLGVGGTVIFFKVLQPQSLNGRAGALIFSGLCLYSGIYSAAFLVKAVTSEYFLSNFLACLACGSVAVYTYVKTAACEDQRSPPNSPSTSRSSTPSFEVNDEVLL